MSWAVLSCKSLPSLCPCWTPASPHSCVAAVSPLGTEGSDWLALLPPWPSGGSCGEDLGPTGLCVGRQGADHRPVSSVAAGCPSCLGWFLSLSFLGARPLLVKSRTHWHGVSCPSCSRSCITSAFVGRPLSVPTGSVPLVFLRCVCGVLVDPTFPPRNGRSAPLLFAFFLVLCYHRCPHCSCLLHGQLRPAAPLTSGVFRASSLSALSRALDSPQYQSHRPHRGSC